MMKWIAVTGASKSGSRLIAASDVTEVVIDSFKSVMLVDRRNQLFVWKTSGTMAEYAKLAQALGLTDVA